MKILAESRLTFWWISSRKSLLFLLKFSQKVNIVSVKFLAERWCTFCQLCRRKLVYFLLNFFRKWVLFPLNFSQKMNISSAKFLAPLPPLPKSIGNPVLYISIACRWTDLLLFEACVYNTIFHITLNFIFIFSYLLAAMITFTFDCTISQMIRYIYESRKCE
jgi:hypothetical protein